MNIPAHRALLIAGLTLALAGTAALAQETGTSGDAAAEPAQAPETEAPAAEAPAAEAPAAEAAPAAPAGGEPAAAPTEEILEVVKATHGDWEVRCAPEGADCFMYQLAMDSENNPVAEFSLVRLAEGAGAAAGATVVSPLGTLLPAGVELQIDDGEARRYPFTWCSQVGCFARFGVDDAAITAMKAGTVAKAVLVSVAAPDRPLLLEVSLTGFTAAYDSLEPATAPN